MTKRVKKNGRIMNENSMALKTHEKSQKHLNRHQSAKKSTKISTEIHKRHSKKRAGDKRDSCQN